MRVSSKTIFLVSLLTSFAQAVPFVNGNFEAGTTGWTSTGTAVPGALYTNPNDPLNFGARFAAFNAGDSANNGVLSQTFDTVIGQTYLVQYFTGNLNATGGLSTQTILAEVLDGSMASLASLTTSRTETSNTDTSLALVYAGSPYSLSFVATSLTSTLRFSDIGSNTVSTDLFLDNISVQSVPELNAASAAAPLTFAGLALLVLQAPRRRRTL